MFGNKYTTNKRKFQHLTSEKRAQIEVLLNLNMPKTQIAKTVGIVRYTLYEELKRGTVTHVYTNLKSHKKYFADAGQCKFKVTVCAKTLYNYIDMGFLNVKNIDLPLRVKRKTKTEKSRKNRRTLGNSIENRSESINSRGEFGYREIDTILLPDTARYYAYPYSLFERGTNEKQNSLVRRFLLKGKSFKKITEQDVKFIEDWINNLPRKIFNHRTANEVFDDFT